MRLQWLQTVGGRQRLASRPLFPLPLCEKGDERAIAAVSARLEDNMDVAVAAMWAMDQVCEKGDERAIVARRAIRGPSLQ